MARSIKLDRHAILEGFDALDRVRFNVMRNKNIASDLIGLFLLELRKKRS
jgi:hypothetical protein